MSGRAETATIQLKVRTKEPLRAALEQAAGQRGISLNSEIVRRLDRSFADDERFGGSEMLAVVNMLAGAFLRGLQLGASAQQHPEWTTAQQLADPLCYRAAAYAVADALHLPTPTSAAMSDPAGLHELLTGAIGRGVRLTVKQEKDK
jgi:hypothetical protein